MRAQAEAVGAIVIAMLLLAGLFAYSIAIRSASRQLRESSELAVLDATRRAEELYFFANATGIYARSTLDSTVVYIAAYDETGVVYESVLPVRVSLNWTLVVANSTVARMVKSGGAHLVVVTERGNVFTWDPMGGLAQPGFESNPLVAVLPVGFKLFVGSSGSADALVHGPSVYPYAQFGTSNVDVFAGSMGALRCVFAWLTYNRTSGSLSGCGQTVSYAVQGDSVTVSSSGGYVQVYRVLRVLGTGAVSLAVELGVSAPASTALMPVVYVYDASYDLVLPVTTYTPLGVYTGGSIAVFYAEHFRPVTWLARIRLEESPVNAALWSKTYTARVDLSDLALGEAYILVGVEALAGSITVAVSVSTP